MLLPFVHATSPDKMLRASPPPLVYSDSDSDDSDSEDSGIDMDPLESLMHAASQYPDMVHGFSGINLCTVCGVDMGDINPRQLCGKLICDNQESVDREKYIRNKLQCKILIVSRVMGCYLRAVETANAPDGRGYKECQKRFNVMKGDAQQTKRIKKKY